MYPATGNLLTLLLDNARSLSNYIYVKYQHQIFTYSYIHKEWNYNSANLWSYGHWQWSFGSLVPKVIKIFGRDSQDQYWLDFWIFGSDGGTVAGAAHTCDVFLIKSSFRLNRRRIVKIALLYTHWHHWCTSVPWLRRRIVNIFNINKGTNKGICTSYLIFVTDLTDILV